MNIRQATPAPFVGDRARQVLRDQRVRNGRASHGHGRMRSWKRQRQQHRASGMVGHTALTMSSRHGGGWRGMRRPIRLEQGRKERGSQHRRQRRHHVELVQQPSQEASESHNASGWVQTVTHGPHGVMLVDIVAELRELNLSFQQLPVLPASIHAFRNLRRLNFSHNAACTMPWGWMVDNLPLLVELDVSHNNIAADAGVQELSRLTYLRKLDVSHNPMCPVSAAARTKLLVILFTRPVASASAAAAKRAQSQG